MGCDWSKTAGSVDDLRDAPYSLLSVTVEEGRMLKNKNKMSPAGKKREKRKTKEKNEQDSVPPIKIASQAAAERDSDSAAVRKGGPGPHDKENTALPKPDINITQLKPRLQLDISKTLDVKREPTERQQRQEKLLRYEKECTKIEDYLYVGGIRVAENKELLVGCGITDIVNCAAITTANCFPDAFRYKAVYINDAPNEDIACHIYEVVKFVDEVRAAGRRVLVHCTQGVSRSCSLCIAYLMLRERLQYDEAFTRVKTRRGICNPNAGFCSQLVRYGRRILGGVDGRRGGREGDGEGVGRLLKVDYYYQAMPAAGVAAMQQSEPEKVEFAPEAAYICQTASKMFIWVGLEASEQHRECALREVKSFQDYEQAATEVAVVRQGEETPQLRGALEELGCSRALGLQAEGGGRHGGRGEEGGGGRGRSLFPEGGAECVVQTPRVHTKDAGVVALKLDGVGRRDGERGGIAEEAGAQGGGGEEEEEEKEEAAVRMFEVIGAAGDGEGGWEFEEIEAFDSDDLWPSKAFVLVQKTEGGEREMVVWIGGEYEGVEDAEDEDACQQFAKDASDHLAEEEEVACAKLEVVVDGNEPDEFWDLFELG